MATSVKFFFLTVIMIFMCVLSLSPSAEAVPLSFPERDNKHDNSESLSENQIHTKCPKGYRMIRGNCRKVYGRR